MTKLLLWCLLFVFCWPLALFALAALPVIFLLSLPFRLIGFAFHAVFSLAWIAFVLWAVWSIVTLPFRILGMGPYAKPQAVL
jgi:hypothetical protein